MEIFACRESKDFACKVIDSVNANLRPDELPIHLGDLQVSQFSDGEFQPLYAESVRGATVFIIQSTFPPADNLMELLLCIDAAKRASADKVIAVIPYFGWARQDRKDRPRVAIGAKLVANLLTAAGADRVMTCDLHADQIQGFFDIPVDHVYASKVFLPAIQSLGLPNIAVAAPTGHMAMASEQLSALRRVRPLLRHVHVENALTRALPAPGDGEDYGRLIETLKDIGYAGGVTLCGTITERFAEDANAALEWIRKEMLQ